jgi:DNA polymerase III subunit alpha
MCILGVRLRSLFTRPIPDTPEYKNRLDLELSWFQDTPAAQYLETVAHICRHISHIPHIIRGSAGSSLVVYGLGISDIDPVAWNIKPERFFHPRRKSLPDIDLDFPDNRRDEVFRIIYKLFPGRVARISNHPIYSDKSAIREAVRRLGYRKRLPKKFVLGDVVPGQEQRAIEIASDLRGQIMELSLHCGGIIVFNEPIPESMLTTKENQIRIDKIEAENSGLMKIDILSSISLTQLHDMQSRPLDQYPQEDEGVSKLLSSGDSFGITQAESPAFQKMLRAIRPRNLSDMIMCMALIRPASAWRSHRKQFVQDWAEERDTDLMVYEDDATRVIQTLTGLPGPESDELRRAFLKGETAITSSLRRRLESTESGQSILRDIMAFRTFSMCKSHSVSYGRVAWALAWHKVYDKKNFWRSAVNHAKSMWRPWVHIEEAKLAGWNFLPGKRPFIADSDTLYPEGATPTLFASDSMWELSRYGMWSGSFPRMCGISYDEDRVNLTGLIGTHRMLKKSDGNAVTFATLGTSPGSYSDVVIEGAVDLRDFVAIEGSGIAYSTNGSETIKLERYKLIR